VLILQGMITLGSKGSYFSFNSLLFSQKFLDKNTSLHSISIATLEGSELIFYSPKLLS